MITLTETHVTEIRQRWADGESVEDIADRFGVAKTTAFLAATGRTWRHVTMPAKRRASQFGPRLAAKGENHYRSRLTAGDVRQIRSAAAQGMAHQALAEQFGVSRQTVSHIVHRRVWAAVD